MCLFLFEAETKELKESFFKAKEEIENLKSERLVQCLPFIVLLLLSCSIVEHC